MNGNLEKAFSTASASPRRKDAVKCGPARSAHDLLRRIKAGKALTLAEWVLAEDLLASRAKSHLRTSILQELF
jgi:hypothetical protein